MSGVFLVRLLRRGGCGLRLMACRRCRGLGCRLRRNYLRRRRYCLDYVLIASLLEVPSLEILQASFNCDDKDLCEFDGDDEALRCAKTEDVDWPVLDWVSNYSERAQESRHSAVVDIQNQTLLKTWQV